MKKTASLVAMSIIGLLISLALVTVGTWALFTGKATVNNHLEAGKLEVGLTRTEYTAYCPNEDGLMATTTVKDPVNLLENSNKIFNVSHAVPHCEYTATIAVENKGSVAFEYGARILWTADAKNMELAEQMKITVSYLADGAEKATETSFMLSESAGKDVYVGVVLKGKAGSFTVKAEFVNLESDEEQNKAQSQSVSFDVQVYATQYVADAQ